MRGPIPVTPVTESLRVSDRQVRTTRALRTDTTRFYSRRPAPAVERVPFEQQRTSMERAVQRSFGGNAGGPVTAAQPAAGGWRRVEEPRSAPADRGATWRQFGTPAHSESAPAVATPRSDWQRFPNRTSEESPASGNSGRFGTWRGQNAPAVQPERAPARQETQRYERSQPIRFNPPIVRERSEVRSVSRTTQSAPRASGGGSRSSSGGGESRGGGGSRSSSGGGSSRGSSGGRSR